MGVVWVERKIPHVKEAGGGDWVMRMANLESQIYSRSLASHFKAEEYIAKIIQTKRGYFRRMNTTDMRFLRRYCYSPMFLRQRMVNMWRVLLPLLSCGR